jgi:hypothetical protein
VFVGDARSGERAVLEPSSALKAGASIRPATK